jgi:hypothetical protein
MTDFLDTFAELDAAFGEQDGVVTLPLELIDEDPQQPRETFDARELADLAETVRRRGVLQPIVVGPQDAQGRYRLRFGARRLRAARLAGLVEIRALVRSGQVSEADVLIEQVLASPRRRRASWRPRPTARAPPRTSGARPPHRPPRRGPGRAQPTRGGPRPWRDVDLRIQLKIA